MDKSYLLSAILPVISTTLSITFLALWHRQRQRLYVFNWFLAYGCAAVGSSLDIARILIDNAAPVSVAANMFLVGVAFFAVRGAILRHTGRTCDRILVPIYLVTSIGGVWLGVVAPSIVGRGLVSSAGAAIMFLLAVRVMARRAEADRLDRLTIATFAVSAVVLLARPMISYLYEGPLQEEAQIAGSFWIVSFKLFAMLSWFATALLFLLRITTDLMKELAEQSLTDPLTGIANRRGLFAAAGRLLENAGPSRPAVLMLFDIDHFKAINDSYGHGVGDAVIKGLADVLRRASHDTGCAIGRLGGEEFVAVLPSVPLVAATAFADELRKAFAAGSYHGVPPSHAVSVSIGIAEHVGGENVEALMGRADEALYAAKRDGRNRVSVAVAEHARAVRALARSA